MKLILSEIFGDHMVLQREKTVMIWGQGIPSETVTVGIQGQKVTVKIAENGTWRAEISALQTSYNEQMTIESAGSCIVLHDIAVGEVWLAGGQSNMEFFMRYDKEFRKSVKECEDPAIRFFDYPVVTTEKDRQMKDYSDFGYWRTCDADNLQFFSAVGYYFAKKLSETLHVPIGIIGCNCGGTRSCCWMDEETLKECGPVWISDYQKGIENIGDLVLAEENYRKNPMTDKAHPFLNPFADRMMYGVSKEELVGMLAGLAENADGENPNPIGPWHEWRPNGLYHTMLEHVMPYTIRGVIWYQGESDEDHPELYDSMMKALIGLWRKKWGEEIPFITTQLAPYGEIIGTGGRYYPILRAMQEKTADEVPGVYLASIGDVGMEHDIHPKEKQPVGNRLALLALGHVYGKDILCEAPRAEAASKSDDTIAIEFKFAEGGLEIKGDKVNAICIYRNGVPVPENEYTCNVKWNILNIVFNSDNLDKDGHFRVEFAKTPYYEVNLYNKADIPAKPFTIEI